MRIRRFKVTGQTACYHVMSRLVEEVPDLDETCKEMFRQQMWKTAYHCAITVMTYAIMDNHFHILVHVPHEYNFSDEELLKRYRILYPQPNPYQLESIEMMEADLKAGGQRRERARALLLGRMGDISRFMKLLKQRYCIWYNRRHDRRGTLWSERFKSVLVQNSAEALRTVAAYIDLNPVRAALVEDPKDYRFCGYAEWVAGQRAMAKGFEVLFGSNQQPYLKQQYRMILFGKGSGSKRRDGSGAIMAPEKVRKVLRQGGKLSGHELLRCRIRYFSDGCIIGSKEFIRELTHEDSAKAYFTRRKGKMSTPIGGFEDLGLNSYRQLRGQAFG